MSTDISQAIEALGGPDWLRRRRQSAVERLATASVPSVDLEEWRYSRIGELDLGRYAPVTGPVPSSPPPEIQAVLDAVGDVDAALWTIDGRLGGQTGTTVVVDDSDSGLGSVYTPAADDALAALHEAIATPIHISHKGDGGRVLIVHGAATAGAVSAPRLVVELAAGTSLEVVEVFVSPDGLDHLVLPVTELSVGNEARLTHGSLQFHGDSTWQLGHVVSTVGQSGHLNSGAAAFGSDVGRLVLDTTLAGRGASTDLSAASFGSGTQLLDYRTFQRHVARDTTSNLLFIGALGEKSGSVYTGLIKIGPEARGSNAFQTNNNLKLSNDCWAESVPNLEIENNEVHCSHASTVSPVDPEHRFYLESRGVPADRAERLLVRGFFDEVTQKIPTLGLETLIADRIDIELERTL